MNLGYTTRALRHRNYRNFLFSSTISSIGTWMQAVALGWLVFRLTGSAFLLGVVTVVPLIPVLPISLLAGVITDRYPQRPILLVTQTLLALQVLVLAVLVWLDMIQIWHIVLLNFGIGAMMALEQPLRRVFILNLVGRKDIVSAVSMSTSSINLARIIGPVLAGLLIAATGEATTFFINAFTFVPVILVLLAMRGVQEAARKTTETVARSLTNGFRYLVHTPDIRNLMVIIGAMGLLITPYIHLMPAIAAGQLQLDAQGLGWLMAMVGFGSIAGALFVSGMRRGGEDVWIAVTAVVTPILLLLFVAQQSFYLAAVFVIALAASSVTLRTATIITLQIRTEDVYQGRIISIQGLLLLGLPRVGALMLGATAEFIGLSMALAIGAAVALVLGVFVFVRRPHRSRQSADMTSQLEKSAGQVG